MTRPLSSGRVGTASRPSLLLLILRSRVSAVRSRVQVFSIRCRFRTRTRTRTRRPKRLPGPPSLRASRAFPMSSFPQALWPTCPRFPLVPVSPCPLAAQPRSCQPANRSTNQLMPPILNTPYSILSHPTFAPLHRPQADLHLRTHLTSVPPGFLRLPLVPMSPCPHAPSRERVSPCHLAHLPPR